MTSRRSRRRRTLLRIALVAVISLAVDQAVNWLLLGEGYLLGVRVAPFDPPLFMRAQQETLERLREQARLGGAGGHGMIFDPELGWTQRPFGPGVDWAGGRIGHVEVQRQRTAGVRRLAVFGCSFTYGSEVAGAQGWPSQLDEGAAGVQVLNMGVPGFGIDQALLRYRRTAKRLDADEVWLGFTPSTCLRLVSVYRPALRHYSPTVAMKPRFALVDEVLRPVSSVTTSIAELVAIIHDPNRFLQTVGPHDEFVSRWPSAYSKAGSHAAHWTATGRLLLTLLERGGRDWPPRLADPADPVHRLAAAIITTMAREVSAAGAEFRLVILPAREDLAAEPNRACAVLLDAVRSAGVQVRDVTPDLRAAGAATDAGLWEAGGHYSAAANAVVARALASSRGW